MLSNLPITTNDLIVMGGVLAVFLVLSVLVFFRRGS
jgi:ABC-type transport system involved in multi-copper enzyme maturation permease subunit